MSKKARQSIEENDAVNLLSIASLWEMAIKISLGKLKLKTDFSEIFQQILDNGFQILPVTFEDAITISKLPFHHRDSFDRMLISQSLTNKLAIISGDKIFDKYEIPLIW